MRLNTQMCEKSIVQMKVMKFGGTSVGSVNSILNLKGIVEAAASNEQVIVVVSALGGITGLKASPCTCKFLGVVYIIEFVVTVIVTCCETQHCHNGNCQKLENIQEGRSKIPGTKKKEDFMVCVI